LFVVHGKTLEEIQAAEPTKAKGFLKPAEFPRILYAGKKRA